MGRVGAGGWTEPATENLPGAAGLGVSLVPRSNHRPPSRLHNIPGLPPSSAEAGRCFGLHSVLRFNARPSETRGV